MLVSSTTTTKAEDDSCEPGMLARQVDTIRSLVVVVVVVAVEAVVVFLEGGGIVAPAAKSCWGPFLMRRDCGLEYSNG